MEAAMRVLVCGVLAAALAGCNGPPTAPVVSIEPAEPRGNDDLELVIVTPAVDPNKNDVLTTTITWLRDDEVVDDLADEESVSFARTRRGQTWTVQVSVTDPRLFSASGEATVEIGNSRPIVSSVTLSPTEVRTDGSLEAAYEAADPDGDPIEGVTYTWLINGTPISVSGATLSGLTGFDKDDEVVVQVTVDDGVDESVPKASNAVIVGNTPPTSPEIAIRPEIAGEDDELHCQITTPATDLDEEGLTYSFSWDVDGAPRTGEGRTVYLGDTVVPSQTESGQTWRCEVTVSDGDYETAPVSATASIGGGGGVPGFDGQVGPPMTGWSQCAGYLDRRDVEDIPDRWADLCAGAEYNRVRVVCGDSIARYRYVDVRRNVFRTGLTGFPETGLITAHADQSGRSVSLVGNEIWAESSNNPNGGRSWWINGDGCGESNPNLTVNNISSCVWEAANCFGQGLTGDRYLWVYVAR